MKRSIIITLILASLLFAVSNTIAADYVSSAFPSDNILKQLAGHKAQEEASVYVIMGKVKDPTDKAATIVYAYNINNPDSLIYITLKKTDRNYWFYIFNVDYGTRTN